MIRLRFDVCRAAFAFATLLAAAAPGGCSSQTPVVSPEIVRVDALLTGRHVALTRARATGQVRPAAPGAPEGSRAIHWQLIDTSGAVAATGLAPDVLRARFEFKTAHKTGGVGEVRAGAGTLSIEIPNVEGTLLFWDPDGAKIAETPFHAIARVQEGEVESALVNFSTDVIGTPVPLVDHGAPDTHVNILFLPDGFTEAELPKFHDVASSVAAQLKTVPGYAEHWDVINVYYQDVRSGSSGIADPLAPNAAHSTAFESSFGDDVISPRRCILPSSKLSPSVVAAVQAISRSVSADQVVILANTTDFGGCAMPSDHISVMSASSDALRTVAHEVGHSLFNLADEYDYAPPACDLAALKAGTPNVSSDLSALPWKDLIAAGTPVPTPEASRAQVGAFEGAGYCEHGAYRPSATCIMHSLDEDFCPVCRREVDRYFARRAAGPRVSEVNVHNATGAGLFVGCAGTTTPSCTELTFVAAGASLIVKTMDGSLHLDSSTITGAPVHWSFVRVQATAADVTIYPNQQNPFSH